MENVQKPTDHDPNYRNKDYQHHKITIGDMELTSQLLALYARVNLDDEKNAPDLARTENDEQLSMDRRDNIGTAIGIFFDRCKALATQDRFSDRYVHTGIDMRSKNGIGEIEGGHKYTTLFNGKGNFRTHQVTDNFTDDLNRYAMESIMDLTRALNDNNAFAALDPDMKAFIEEENQDILVKTDNDSLFGQYYGDPEKDLKRQSHEKTIGIKDSLGIERPFKQTVSESSSKYAYDMMIGIAKTLETKTAGDLAKEFSSKSSIGLATRMLFKKEADLSFQRASEEIKAREPVPFPSR